MNKRQIILLHTGYWSLILVQTLLVSLGTGVLGTQIDWGLAGRVLLPVKILQVSCTAAFFYVNYLFLIPRFLKAGNLYKYLAAIISCVMLFTPLYYLMEQRVYPLIGWKTYQLDLDFRFAVMVTLSANFIHIFLALLLSYLMDWRSLRVKKEIAEKEHLKTELAFLRSQVNPHFLFNTINDIYALTQQQSKEAPSALLKLSGLLRYMLRESEEQFVPLDNEIAYLENVIELQRVGQKHSCYVDFRKEGNFSDYKIAPMILINFIENTFKHGVFNDPDNPILILIGIENKELEFQVSNQIKPLKKDKTGGIGLPNVRRRLSLIYPNRHELRISEKDDSYSVALKIKLI